MTETVFKNLLAGEISYASNLLRRNNVRLLQPEDVVFDAYSENGFDRGKMKDLVISERRRNKTFIIDEKTCTKCKQLRSKDEYYFRVDYRLNCRYYMQPCKYCFKSNYMNKIFKHIKSDDWGIHCEINGKQYLFATTEFYGGESVYGVRFPGDDHIKKFVSSKRAKNFYLKFEGEVKRFLKTSGK